jgi:predicted DNA-binding transcriptional regulator AlpA
MDHNEKLTGHDGGSATEPLWDVGRVAAWLGVSIASVWRGAANGNLPQPVYPSPRCPRWYPNVLREAVQASRQMPRDAMALRRAERIARSAGQPARLKAAE